ncbi:UDP-N-acetylmuramoyl-tripeptide--D-alanyl-D-alanine ligase [Leptothrix discophora]|uniref:UDP-N-acetylmuramoyl-tripeptide--D-alanyl-D-alanine ligase n=1 Tax=Leptothrix discophora TaxID=89 RepID=A0ABT9FZS5_LEPDI|nr:UDP-N-acetylmuramoyl-tripeptide--D-alanyl-D-alanine ligase [Leptothrix discophora]MDP4299731.1 UDP-N-acetylmuramoyl-tripeptide--D-alanyl-D-alanine ligase [Leptothrix discophora]
MTTTWLTLAQAHALIQRRIPQARLVGDGTTPLLRAHSDTRTLKAGDLFVALRGERFDANDFIAQARDAGAVAALAERGLQAARLSGIEVPDSLAGLQALATAWRAGFALPLIAVTGSNGKTTVTQMIAAILRAWQGEAAHATAGNFNNHIGVPLTLLALRETHRASVVELGMNHPGEIAELAAIAQPTVALVNNAQREHQEFMHTVEAVARENGCAIAALPADGTAVFPADETHTPIWRTLAGARRVLTFALADEAAAAGVQADCLAHADWAGDHWQARFDTPAGRMDMALAVAGRHNVKNALAAATCALAAGCPAEAIQRGLAGFAAVKGRSQVSRLDWGGRAVTLIDDSYNANPDSMRAAIEVLAALPAPRWLLLGDMGEVGDQGPAFHAEVGALAAERGIEHLWTAGTLAAEAARAYAERVGQRDVRHAAQHAGAQAQAVSHHDDTAALLAALAVLADPVRDGPAAASVLVKGSRFMAMEKVVAALRARAAASSGTAGEQQDAR